ncbi:hypothetical protein CYMTET_19944 [Cymbomonas tetramitiformis]|uniref:RNA helicase n=1 Tax=Cymbomonas tetramitiformis TaxID=36881 RepID=A0AAE0L4N8_9CHLO|nr:hypothetical protein CYMTET_19944 [Cymbomonas tetramitiformis]
MVEGTCSSAGLPAPWQEVRAEGLVYYWNTETNVTQYERPVGGGAPPPPLGGGFGHDSSRDFGGSSFGGQYDDADGGGGAQEYNAPPPDAYARGGGLGVTNLNYSATDSGDDYRRKNEIVVKSPPGLQCPDPMFDFKMGNFPRSLLDAVYQAGYTAPTPIQAQSWPIALQGYDLISVAKTGSGKTVGYLFPGIMHIQNRGGGPCTVLALAPTRELANQIQEECLKFGRSVNIRSVCLYGGAPKGGQLRDLRSGPQIVIATPGRLNDFLEANQVDLRNASYVVLDEADRMLDMGFEPQIRKILARTPTRRQTLFFTATWPRAVVRVASAILTNPIQVNIGDTENLVANKDITQVVEICTGFQKQNRLMDVLRMPQYQPCKAIVFCSTKRMCDQIGRSMGHNAGVIHGDKEQRERDYILGQFRSGRCQVLVATDVAARGLDISDVNLVVNFDFPGAIEDYVHRIGRTGRAGKKGNAHTFLDPNEGNMARKLLKILRDAQQEVPREVEELAARGGGGGGGGGGGRFRGGGSRGGGGGFGGGGFGGGSFGGGGYGGGGGGRLRAFLPRP